MVFIEISLSFESYKTSTFHGQDAEFFNIQDGGARNKPRHCVLKCRFTK